MDPITLEIIKGKLLSTADEMAVVLARTSMSPVIYEVLDFACGICDNKGNLVSQTNGVTLFTGTFSTQVKFIINKFSKNTVDGDIFLTHAENLTSIPEALIFSPLTIELRTRL